MPTVEERPADLRARAATARRLAYDLLARDAEALYQLADELEAQAAAIEEFERNQAKPENGQSV